MIMDNSISLKRKLAAKEYAKTLNITGKRIAVETIDAISDRFESKVGAFVVAVEQLKKASSRLNE